MKINKNAMIRSYAQSIGIEAAKDLITKKIKSAALEEKEHYTEEETAKICGELIKEGGLIRIVAQNFVVQLERKRSEEQALLLDNIETQIWYLTDIETYGAVNKAHAEFLGMEKGKLEGRVLYDIISVEEADVCIANNREVFEKKKQTRTEEWVKNGKGKMRLLSITRTPKIDDNGNVEYVICAAEDITERKRAEEHIEHLNSVLKAIRDVNQLIIVEKDRDSLLQKACNVIVEARGYDAAWLGFLSDGKTFAMVKGSGFREEVARFCEHVMGGDHPPCIRNALAQKEKLVVVDRSRECGDCFFKSACVGNEAAIIRVEHANRLFGLLAILFAPGVTADKEEKGLLKEVAGDISFALHDMEMEEARKKAEEALLQSEIKYRTLVEHTPAITYIAALDKSSTTLYVSPQIETILSISPADYKADPDFWVKHLHPDDRERVMDEIRRCHESDQPFISEYRMVSKDGRLVWLSDDAVIVKDDKGKQLHLQGVMYDITERKRAEELLRNAEKDWRDSFNSLEDVMLIIDRDYNIENINEIGLKLLGKSKEKVIGKKCYQIIMGADSPSEECPCMKSLETKKVESLDRYEERFGKYFSIKSSPIFDENGEIIKFVDLRRDITEHKQAEEKLKEYSENLELMVQERTKELRRVLNDTEESRDKIDGILKSVANGLIVTDTYNRIILMNRAAENLLGVRFSEVIDRPIDVAIKDETLRQRFKKSLEEREPGYQFDFELPGDNSKHPRIICAKTSEIKDKTGNQTGIITLICDVTLEREVDRMKTEFLSTASHQLRTPLTSILGFSEILMTRDNIKKEQQKEFLSHINTQSINLTNIINDLLDISRIESGIGFILHKVSCNINEIIRETVKHFQASYPERQFDVILPKEPVELMVDKDKIVQVLENILSNAVKYSPEGGAICLTAKKILDFGLGNADLKDEEQSAIEISVADQGMGMSPDQVKKIFDKFYRADASDSAISGTGLGMSIVKNYVEAHGGKIWVESELGKGTVVTFVIPT